MRFPPSFIERLRSHFLLSDVIGRRIPLKRHGREFQALCPFHNEKTPSFTVNDEKNFFHCFGCGAHGDAIEFIMRHDRLTYPETIEKLARDAGIPLPVMTKEEARRAEAEKTLTDVCEAACRWFEQQLARHMHARSYVEKRGLTDATIKTFRIGFAPDERQGLYQYLIAQGFQQPLIAEAGLIIIPDEGIPYDRFRGRVMFPIRSASGKIVAFGGRLLDSSNKNLPKYLNSPETPVFKKGEMLFNLDLARRPARATNMVAVMEGYMDVVSTAQSGIDYAVATLGTAVTPEHLRLLWQLAKEPVMCLDGDEAGRRAMLRAAEVALPLLKPGYSLRFAILPKGEDPDSYIQKYGKASFEKLLHASQLLSQVLWDATAPQFKTTAAEGRAALEDALKKLAGCIADPTVRQHYLSFFKQKLWERNIPGKAQARSPHIEHLALSHHSSVLETLAERLLKTLIACPELLHKNHIEDILSRMDIRTQRLDNLRHLLIGAIEQADIDDRAAFAAYITAQMPEEWIAKLMETAILPLPEAERIWNATLMAHELAHMRVELEELQETMGDTIDEASYLRLLELKAAIHKAQEAKSFAPPETDVA